MDSESDSDYSLYEEYGECVECNQNLTNFGWCGNCNIQSVQEDFHNWTSGNEKIDEFLRYTQLNAKGPSDFLEWIDFNSLELIEDTNQRGALSTIYTAIWLEGPKQNLDRETRTWSRNGPTTVILKRLERNINPDFIVNKRYIIVAH